MGTDRERILKMALNGETIHSGHFMASDVQMALNGETIHSGHFMASNVHESKLEDDEEIDVVSESGVEPPDPDVTPDTKDDKPVTFYKFGPETTRSIAIDVSLTKLNKCIQIAYEKGKLTTPKWKNFKGMKLQWKDRIRLNNVIWRAWHMQFVQNNKPKYCFFSVPEEDWHGRSDASILEGMYWKRRLETVCAQYTRWRHFYFKRGRRRRASISGEMPLLNRRSSESDTRVNLFDDEILFPTSFTPLTFDNDDDFTSWFTDTLFSSLNQPYMFPDPKQFAQSANADLMQPGLTGLQPSLEEIMASLESSSSFLTSENDPTLAAVEQMDQANSVGDSNLDLLRGSSVNPGGSSSSSSSSNHYTSKDYADASLLVNYSKRATSGGQTPGPPITAPYRSMNLLPSTAPAHHLRHHAHGGGYQRQNESVYSDSTEAYPPAALGTLCEPYVPQVATIDTIRSQPVQYTVAKTWHEETAPQQVLLPPAPPQQRRQRGQTGGDREHYSTKNRNDDNRPQEDSKSYSSTSAVIVSRTRSAPVTEGLLKARTPTAKQPRRSSKKKPPPLPIDGKNIEILKPASETKSSTTAIATSRDPILAHSPVTSRKNIVTTPPHSSALTMSTTTARFSEAAISVNCDMETPLTYGSNDASSNNTNNPLFTSPCPSSLLQNSNVLRPIPISFGRTDSSAFSPLSPSSSGGFGNHSPLQRSPATAAVSSTDFLRNNGSTPTPTTLVHITPTGTGPFLSSVTSHAQPAPPVLILQSLTGMPFPLMALPYTAGSTSFTPAVPKQEPVDKMPVSVYNPLNFATAVATSVAASSTSGNNFTELLPVKEEPQISHSHKKSGKTKSTKRAADSTFDPTEWKRVQHLNAEQSRRSALKNGFELLEEMLPDFQAANTKATNALVLMKSAERIRDLKTSTVTNSRTITRLKAEIQELNEKISAYQNRLPVQTVSSKSSFLQQKHAAYVKQRSQADSKFWILHKITEPLFESFKSEVQGVNRSELFASAQDWAAKHCNHAVLRPVVSQLLVSLATDSPILSEPSSFSAYAFAEASKL